MGKEAIVDGFLRFITKDVVKLELDATDKAGAIAEMVGLLVKAGKVDKKDQEALVQAIQRRESLGSTGIGRGIAIPHAKSSPLVKTLVGAFARSSKGVDFGAIDGEPCRIFFLMVWPVQGGDDPLRVLKNVGKFGRDDHYCKFIEKAKDVDEIIGILREWEEKAGG